MAQARVYDRAVTNQRLAVLLNEITESKNKSSLFFQLINSRTFNIERWLAVRNILN